MHTISYSTNSIIRLNWCNQFLCAFFSSNWLEFGLIVVGINYVVNSLFTKQSIIMSLCHCVYVCVCARAQLNVREWLQYHFAFVFIDSVSLDISYVSTKKNNFCSVFFSSRNLLFIQLKVRFHCFLIMFCKMRIFSCIFFFIILVFVGKAYELKIILAIDDILLKKTICVCVWIDFNQVRQVWKKQQPKRATGKTKKKKT